MDQKKLYRTIETVASEKCKSDKDLLIMIVQQIVNNDSVGVTGGRLWELIPQQQHYKLLYQAGNVEKIDENHVQKISDFPYFAEVAEERTILADETDEVLIQKGILRYSASGVGEKIKVNGTKYYKYLIAVNSEEINEKLRYTLNILATALTSKLKERQLAHTQKNLIDGIDKAKQIQKSILPEHAVDFHKYDIFGVAVPAEILGGDFFDYLSIGAHGDRLGIVVGDAASKGFGAAAEAMYISGAVRMACEFEIKISPLMYRMNMLVNKIFSDDKFATMFYGELSNDKKGLFLYANAGHNPPFFYKKRKNEIITLDPTGPLLGPAPHSKYETDSVNFEDGDVLVIYSDGIVEAANNKYDLYSEERLQKALIANVDKSSKEIAQLILQDVMHFSTSDSQYQDDKTLVVIKRKEKNESV
ncbi:MAG: serine/threonine-protein phosphatase [Bacteroidetes bacterium]|nr:serine/threonine-protein phosphatase [Bacteroidota bacterium]